MLCQKAVRTGGRVGVCTVVCNAQHCYQVVKLWDAFITLVFIPDVLRLAPNTL